MATEALNFPVPPTATDNVDGTQSYNMGTAFTVSESVACSGIRWWVPDSLAAPAGGAHVAGLWKDGVRVRNQTITPTPGGYQDFPFTTQGDITLNPGEQLVASVFTVHYPFRAGAAVYPVSTSGGQATATGSRYTTNGSPTDLPDVAGTSIYYVSPLIEIASELPPVDGSGALILPPLVLSGSLVVDNPVSGEPAHGFALRAPMAQALSAVSGVQGFPKAPSAAKVGDAWPRHAGLTHVSQGGWENNWQVVIKLPEDELARDEWLIQRLEAIEDALAPLVWITTAEIGTSGDSPALLINCKE